MTAGAWPAASSGGAAGHGDQQQIRARLPRPLGVTLHPEAWDAGAPAAQKRCLSQRTWGCCPARSTLAASRSRAGWLRRGHVLPPPPALGPRSQAECVPGCLPECGRASGPFPVNYPGHRFSNHSWHSRCNLFTMLKIEGLKGPFQINISFSGMSTHEVYENTHFSGINNGISFQ